MDRRTYFELVVAMSIAQVSSSNLGGHVPSVERGAREMEPAAVERHAGNCRDGKPAKSQSGEPVIRRVLELHFQDKLRRDWKDLRDGTISGLENQREDVESGASSDPAQFLAHLGEFHADRIADDDGPPVFGHFAVSGVANQLLVPHAELSGSGFLLGENRDGRALPRTKPVQ